MKIVQLICMALLASVGLQAQTFDEVKEMQKYEGFFNFWYDADKDGVYMEVDRLEEEFLYVHSLSSGMGSNDLGLDRGQIGGEKVVFFRRAGDRILLMEPNLDYRANTENVLERQAVEQAFARSVIFSFPIMDQEKERYLVKLENMLFEDIHRVSERIARMQEGQYKVDRSRSALELSRTKAFPDNVEFDALLTFSGKSAGRMVREVTPDARWLTINQHHSFIRLPDDNYRPRNFHPGSGCISMSYMDYAVPVYEDIHRRFIIRHRLQKKHPEQALSEAVEPIVYYLDNGTPEPVRSALLEGAGWWEEAFREIGFKDAFRVELLPEDADPMDVRYNVIQWVHRSTRGWSYGNAVTDPRTGEIIKGHVSLGSLRVRQDFLIAQALLNRPYAEDDQNHEAMMEMALARIRQLSVHEIGHTLGFVHNYAASTNGRASVMDYPHPLVYAENGEVKLDRAYARGVGDWDKVTVAYAYSEFGEDEEAGLEQILRDAADAGLRYISDYDARATGGAHPHAHLWDNGASAIDELDNILEVRSTAIAHFSEDNIRSGEPLSVLEDVFVPLYFFHRYQVEAACKLVGGLDYTYQVKGDGSAAPQPLPAALQQEAIEAVLSTLHTSCLMIPEDKLELFPPRAPGYERKRESFRHRTGPTFDYLAPPSAAAHMTLALLLHPERANRLVIQHSLDATQPGLDGLLTSLKKELFDPMSDQRGYEGEVASTIRFITIDHLIGLALSEAAYPQVKALVKVQLEALSGWIASLELEGVEKSYATSMISQIKDMKVIHLQGLPEIPPGSPIGMACFDH